MKIELRYVAVFRRVCFKFKVKFKMINIVLAFSYMYFMQ
jgi:hypothetical protein